MTAPIRPDGSRVAVSRRDVERLLARQRAATPEGQREALLSTLAALPQRAVREQSHYRNPRFRFDGGEWGGRPEYQPPNQEIRQDGYLERSVEDLGGVADGLAYGVGTIMDRLGRGDLGAAGREVGLQTLFAAPMIVGRVARHAGKGVKAAAEAAEAARAAEGSLAEDALSAADDVAAKAARSGRRATRSVPTVMETRGGEAPAPDAVLASSAADDVGRALQRGQATLSMIMGARGKQIPTIPHPTQPGRMLPMQVTAAEAPKKAVNALWEKAQTTMDERIRSQALSQLATGRSPVALGDDAAAGAGAVAPAFSLDDVGKEMVPDLLDPVTGEPLKTRVSYDPGNLHLKGKKKGTKAPNFYTTTVVEPQVGGPLDRMLASRQAPAVHASPAYPIQFTAANKKKWSQPKGGTALPRWGTQKEPAYIRRMFTPDAENTLIARARVGQEHDGDWWYETGPLRDYMDNELGSADPFRRFIYYSAATSPRTAVQPNLARAGYLYMLDRNGMLNDGTHISKYVPEGLGTIAGPTHMKNVQRFLQGQHFDPRFEPKIASYFENQMGNWEPLTSDTHNQAAIAHARYGKFKAKESPKDSEYRFWEDRQRAIARKMGIDPAQFQSSLWVGSTDLTGVRDPRPWLMQFDDLVASTAREFGVSKGKILQKWVRGEMPLFTEGMGGGTSLSNIIRQYVK